MLCDENGSVLRLYEARGLARIRGLIGRPGPPRGSGVFFRRCSSVHGFGMTYAIDVIFIDRAWIVVGTGRLRPWRIVSHPGAWSAIELAEGECKRLAIAAGVKFTQREGGQ